MGRRPISRKAMTPAQRQQRWRTRNRRIAKLVAQEIRRETRLAAMTRTAAEASAELAAPGRLYGVIYADPPWRFEPWSRQTGMSRAADNHYATMDTDTLCAIQVPATRDAVLFLWATVPMLPDALRVMTAWGFAYRSAMTWDKVIHGTGYWFRNRLEHLLVGTRGNVPAPLPGRQPDQLHVERRAAHSRKPEACAAMIASLYPDVPRLEMFARAPRPGWTVWGNEASGATSW
jgi:N6-adenosine-specific RNA methylase IME4